MQIEEKELVGQYTENGERVNVYKTPAYERIEETLNEKGEVIRCKKWVTVTMTNRKERRGIQAFQRRVARRLCSS